MNDQAKNILIGDIGGTKTILGIFSSSQTPLNPIRTAQYPSRDFGSLEDILQIFLEDERTVICLASFVLPAHSFREER